MSPETLCVGRLSWAPEHEMCADRGQCQRYLSLLAHGGESIPREIPVKTKLRDSNAEPCEFFSV